MGGPQHRQQRSAKLVVGVSTSPVTDIGEAFEELDQTRYGTTGISFESSSCGHLAHSRAPAVTVGQVEQRHGES